MKRLLVSVSSMLSLVASVCAADGDSFSYNGLNYTVLSESAKTCEVAKTPDAAGAVTVPEKAVFNGSDYTVTTLGEDAFFLNIDMTSVSLPGTLTTIRKGALSRMLNVLELVLPNSVTTIDTRSLYACYAEHFVLSEGLTEIPFEACSGSKFTSLVIPDGLVKIHDDAFNFVNIADLQIGKGLKSMGKNAFAGNKLRSLTIPANVEEIGDDAFTESFLLTDLTLADADTPLKLGERVWGRFYGFSNSSRAPLEKVYMGRNWTCSAGADDQPFREMQKLTEVTFGPLVTNVPSRAFANSPIISVTSYAAECPSVTADAFATNVYTTATLYVLAGSLDAYKAHPVWGRFTKIEVTELPEKPEPELTVSISAPATEVMVGETLILSAEASADDAVLSWTSSAPEVASVDAQGTVTGIAGGTAEITVTATLGDSEADASVTVTVLPDNNDGISAINASSAQPAAAYTLDGRPASEASRGVRIVRLTDGTVLKVLTR